MNFENQGVIKRLADQYGPENLTVVLGNGEANGVEVFEGATMQFVRESEDEAIAAACDEAIRQIDNIIANPLVRLA